MKLAKFTIASLALGSGAAFAGGIDRSGQPLEAIYKDGNYAEFSYVYSWPELTGNDILTGEEIQNVGQNFGFPSFALKFDATPKLSFTLLGTEDFGADVVFPGDPNSSLLAGSGAESTTYSVAGIARYKFTDNWSVHGGLRLHYADAYIALGGLAYGPFNGYRVDLAPDWGVGYLVGGAYEIPEIALRVALTYNSKIRHDWGTQETINGASLGTSSDTQSDLPQSVNLDLQTGIAPNWLLFGGARWVDWSQFKINPEIFYGLGAGPLVTIENTTTYYLGVGHQFTDAFSASAAFFYEEPGDRLVSPLAPYTGLQALQIGGQYRIGDLELSGAVRYSRLGNSTPATGFPVKSARAVFKNNEAITALVRIGYYF